MNKFLKLLSLLLFVMFTLTSCAIKENYHKDMKEDVDQLQTKEDFKDIQNSYTKKFIEEKSGQKNSVDISKERYLSDILGELEVLENKYYFLKSRDIIVPRSRIQIKNIKELNSYLKIVLNRELSINQSNNINVVKLLSLYETKKRSFNKIPFKIKGEITIEELIKLVTMQSGYEIAIGNYIKDKDGFQESLLSIKSSSILDAINSIAHAKNLYIDMNYDDEIISIDRYKDTVIELNIPIFDLKTSSETTSKETSGESKVENSSNIQLYSELDLMLKNIISNDETSTYHIDKSSGLIFLKSTKNIEKAVRNIVNAYEDTFSREAVVEFERIELLLSKSREYGIGNIGTNPTDGTDLTGRTISLNSSGALSFIEQGSTRVLNILGTANNGIGKILNYNKNTIALKNNIPTVQTISQNTDYIEKIETTVNDNVTTSEATVNTIKDGTSITALGKISRDKIFLNITPNIKKLIKIDEATVGDSTIQLPQYNDQSYNISREIDIGETSVVGSIIVHDDAKEYEGIIPLEGFIIGGNDSKSYVRREIVYVVTLKSIKGF